MQTCGCVIHSTDQKPVYSCLILALSMALYLGPTFPGLHCLLPSCPLRRSYGPTPCFRDISCSFTCLCHHLSCSSTWPSSLSLFPPKEPTHPSSPGWNVIFSGKPETCLKAPPYPPRQIKLPFLSLHTSSLTLLFSAPIPHSDLHNLCFCPSLQLESVIPLGLGVLLTSFLQIP